MEKSFLKFLEAYKSLDELCKQILLNDKGISQYIEEMEHEIYGKIYVKGWEKDYKQLKHMRWIRNRMVHEVNSFNYYNISENDIEWLKNFRQRILSRTDPFSLLYLYKNKQQTSINPYTKDIIKREKNVVSYKIPNKKDKTKYFFVIVGILIICLLLYLNFI